MPVAESLSWRFLFGQSILRGWSERIRWVGSMFGSSVWMLTLRSTNWMKISEIKSFLFSLSFLLQFTWLFFKKNFWSCIISKASAPHCLCRHVIETHCGRFVNGMIRSANVAVFSVLNFVENLSFAERQHSHWLSQQQTAWFSLRLL